MISLAALTACDSLLDLTPQSNISETDYFHTASDLQLFSNSFYSDLLDKTPYDDKHDLYLQQILSDEMIGGSKRTVPASGGGWTWTTLRKINTLLANIDNCENEEAVVKYTALSRFFRAFFYFEKVKRFGDVPWYDVELNSSDENLYKPRDSREYIMTRMLEDVDYAIANLPSDTEENSAPFRITKWAAMALKAQFCLYEGTFRKYHNLNLEGKNYTYYLEQSAAVAKKLMDESPYKLYSTGNPESDYLNLFAAEDANPDEYILAIKFDYGVQVYHNATAHTLVSTQGRPGLSRKLICSYLMKDGSRFTDREGWQTMSFLEEIQERDPRLYQTIRTPGYHRIGETRELAPDFSLSVTGYQPIKYVQEPTAAGGNVDRNNFSTADMPVYRLAELYLNYAEAKAELGTLTQADLDNSLNLIRRRVDMPDLNLQAANANPDPYLSSEEYGYPNVTGSNKGVILEIRRERAIELTQEGLRWDDLMRWRAGYCLNQELYGMYFSGPGEYDLTNDGVTDVVLYAPTEEKPTAAKGVQVYKLGEDVILSGEDGLSGYVYYHKEVERTPFNAERDYFYPIPINERSLNPALTQNPGWNDGLDF